MVVKSTGQFITPAAIEWLDQTQAARVLNAFGNSVNLINSTDMILSIVKSHLERGPFTIMINSLPSFERDSNEPLANISAHSKVNITKGRLNIGSLNVDYSNAELWNPRPNWKNVIDTYLDAHLALLRSLLVQQGSAESLVVMIDGAYAHEYQRQIALVWPVLRDGLSRQNIDQLRIGAISIMGLGPGLTPAGDDFLLGVVLSLWASFPSGAKMPLADVIISSAATRTTNLSAAWLKAAARGEASESWHSLIRALNHPEKAPVLRASHKIIRSGHTSGADALTGFILGMKALSKN